MQSRIENYRQLIEQFLAHKLSAAEFEKQFLKSFKGETGGMPKSLFLELDRLFSDIDVYCADDELRTDDELDEEGLRQACERTLIALSNL